MTRKQYMSKLQNYLCFLLPESELAEILTDMEECFDAGLAEGRTEEDIAEGLGEPKTAAKEILAERKQPVNVMRGQFAVKFLPTALCFVLGTVYFLMQKFYYDGPYWVGTNPREIVLTVAGILLPLLMWLILEKENFFGGFLNKPADPLTLLGAVMIFLSAPMFNPVANGILLTSNGEFVYFTYAVTGLIAAAQALLIISICRSKFPKQLCIAPAAVIIAVIAAVCMMMYGMGVFNGVNPSRDDYIMFYSGFGAVLDRYLHIIIASHIIFFLWSMINRSAYSLTVFYLTLLGGLSTMNIRTYFSRVDPARPLMCIDFGNMPVIGAVAAAVSFLAIYITRLVLKNKAAQIKSKDGDC